MCTDAATPLGCNGPCNYSRDIQYSASNAESNSESVSSATFRFPELRPSSHLISGCYVQIFKSQYVTHSRIERCGVASAGVIVSLALCVRAANADAVARGELVARGAQRRVGRRRSGLQTAGQGARGHQKLRKQVQKNHLHNQEVYPLAYMVKHQQLFLA